MIKPPHGRHAQRLAICAICCCLFVMLAILRPASLANYRLRKPPLLSAPTIVVMANDRPTYLARLLDSLSRVSGIEHATLVISHNLRQPAMDAVVSKATFAERLLQIYYPYRLQVYRDRFPGPQATDCPRDATPAEARSSGCVNWRHPDKYGHYREANVVQMKHHFWWMLNYVYARVSRTREGYTILLEEDFLAAPDMLQTLEAMDRQRGELCADCNLLVLGADTADVDDYERSPRLFRQLTVELWDSSEHFRGMALSGGNLAQIFACARVFCTFDDYNFDWSMMHANMHCFDRQWKIMRPSVPRIYHVGSCGFHRGASTVDRHNCHASGDRILQFFEKNSARLRLHSFDEATVQRWQTAPSSPVGYGGWGDPRDHRLCLNMTAESRNVV